MLIKKSESAMDSIDSSSRWRQELTDRAFAEWRSHPRIFWFGRATYSYGSDDERALVASGGFEALIQTSLRRGTTHNLLTDLLIAYGLVGCILYLTLYVAIIFFLWKLHTSRQLSEPAANLTLVCLAGSTFSLLIGVVAGGGFLPEIVWFMIILIASLYRGHGLIKAPQTLRKPFGGAPWPMQPAAARPNVLAGPRV